MGTYHYYDTNYSHTVCPAVLQAVFFCSGEPIRKYFSKFPQNNITQSLCLVIDDSLSSDKTIFAFLLFCFQTITYSSEPN